MPTSNHFLTPHPPTLFSPPKKHFVSGSTNSFSSSSSSSNSRSASYFEQWSRTSSTSAYLTDLTPPITPSNSNLGVESKGEDFDRVSSESSDKKMEEHPLVRSTIVLDEDMGYRSDNEEESNAFEAAANYRTRILKSKQTLGSRRALTLMEARRDYEAVSPYDGYVEMPLLAEDPDNDLHNPDEASEDVGREYFDEENFSRDFDRAMGLIYQEAMNGTYVDIYVDSGPEHPLPILAPVPVIPASQHDLLSAGSPLQMPAKPILKAVEVDSDCSPLSLCDEPSYESSSSISRSSLLSPIQIDANVFPSSPAVYDDYYGHEHSPLPSTHMPILTSAFSSRGQRRIFPAVELTGENLDTASLIRLEVAASNNAIQSRQHLSPTGLGFHMPPQSHPPPSPLSSYPSLQFLESYLDQSTIRGPFVVTSPLADSSLAQGQKQPSVGTGEHLRAGRIIPISSCPAEPDQPLVGLGLGALAEGCLRSSASISKLDTEPLPGVASEANICANNILLDNQQSSPCVSLTGSYLRTEIEPSGVLSGLESLPSPLTSGINLEVQVGVSDTQANREDHACQVSIKEQFSCIVENISGDIIGSEIETNVLSDLLPPADVLQGSVTSARRCSTKPPKRFCHGQGDVQGNVSCGTPSTGLSFASEHATSLSDTVPITPDSTHQHSAITLAEQNNQGSEPSVNHTLALWTNETPRQHIGHSSLLFQDSPLHRLAQVLRSDDYIARFNLNPATTQAPNNTLKEQDSDSSRQGPSSLTAPARSDPRSPCSPSLEYFHPESYILGCLGVAPTALGTSRSSPLSSSSSKRDSATFPSSSDLLRESQSVEGLGLGLPSDLMPRPLREHNMSVPRHTAIGGQDGMSTTQECQNVAQLASVSSPNGGTSRSAYASPRIIFKVPKFVQRRLYVIPEQPTPSPTFSAVRSRTPSPRSQSSSWKWSMFKRLSSSGRSREGVPINEGDLAPSTLDDDLCQPTEDCPTPPATALKNLFQQCYRVMSRRSRHTSSCRPPQLENAGSPGVIEHVDVPRGAGIFGRWSRGRLEPTTRKLHVLF